MKDKDTRIKSGPSNVKQQSQINQPQKPADIKAVPVKTEEKKDDKQKTQKTAVVQAHLSKPKNSQIGDAKALPSQQNNAATSATNSKQKRAVTVSIEKPAKGAVLDKLKTSTQIEPATASGKQERGKVAPPPPAKATRNAPSNSPDKPKQVTQKQKPSEAPPLQGKKMTQTQLKLKVVEGASG